MTDRIPVKAIYTGSDVTSLGELASGDTINGSYITNLGTINNVGSTGQLLSKQASGLAWATVSGGGAIVSGGGYSSLQVFFSDANHATTSHTWTKPANITKIRVFITGGGGGGGYYWGGGGGGGGTSIMEIDVTGIASESITLGEGGHQVTSVKATDGGTSSFGSHCSATGGEGGGPHGHVGDACPGEGGVGSGGDLNLNGDGGGYGGTSGGGGDSGGHGGGTHWGGIIRGEHSSSYQNNYSPNVQSSRWLGQGDGGYLNSGSLSPTNASGGFCVVYEYI